jgi:hypothetical protein
VILALLAVGFTANAATPTPPQGCETENTRQLLTCLKRCSGRDNDASTRVCKQICMKSHEAGKERCVKRTPQLIVF